MWDDSTLNKEKNNLTNQNLEKNGNRNKIIQFAGNI